MKCLSHSAWVLVAGSLLMPPATAAAFLPAAQPLPDAVAQQLLARIGGGGGGARAPRASASRPHSGFGTAGGGLNRGSTRPSGGWSSKVAPERARPSLDRATAPRSGTRDLSPNRELNRAGNQPGNRNVSRTINRDWGRTVSLNNVNLYPGWARPGWGVARPWTTGWYGGWATPAWGWWGARAAAWGITTLTTAAVINAAVSNAVDDHVSYIVVPNTDVQLLYGTVAPLGSNGVSFAVSSGGNSYQLTANCNAGTLNGRDPETAAEAELVNAACQVAFGSA
jgi:hypothetical protein